MKTVSLLWIDWKLAGRSVAREWANGFVALTLLSGFLLAMLASGGVNRYLSEQWVVNALLRLNVSAAEGAGIAAKAGKLPAVRSVLYKDPEAAWKEFLAENPGLESMRLEGGNSVPGYINIRLRPDRLTAEDIAAVESALKPLPQVETVLTGARALPRLLRVRVWLNLSLWGLFGLLSAVYVSMCLLHESARARALRTDFEFLAGRGVSPAAIMTSRAAGGAFVSALVASVAAGAAGILLSLAADRFQPLAIVIGPVGSAIRSGGFAWIALFLSAVPCVHFVAALIGWRRSNFRIPPK
jgi:hypothetical protein